MSNLLYLYGLVPSHEATTTPLPSIKGFDGEGIIYPLSINEVTAFVCELEADQYSEETISNKINNDMEWLQEKAFHHHETVQQLAQQYTIVPLKFCTLYKNPDSLMQTVESNNEKLSETFKLLEGNEEWNLKIYCNDEELKKQVSESNTSIEAKRQEISQLSPGRQFFEKKKIDELINQELENEKNLFCEEIHEKLQKISLFGSIKKNWSKDVTGRKEKMAWNSVFLLPSANVEEFIEEIKLDEETYGVNGWDFEVSGPWPPYHFSSFTS
ncbi:GvpL/GvpF family gas vesicle protein [Pseudalkalibacillus hwajinpoensis]|uniref:GvpL/GvpF family gas vesicle protein n=1 Tax=Guptibacillus hwajinpoensis TaxID=208199 RepID=A0A4V5PYM2_9BACL|nr:GvpL/GvpF family gas vesicle protein [Pseudalkalibacillus hwajinpoensis]TKD70688.1 GvpL/GvpF family gas vesicle protein [Pseudalkalibacillus hwajinpoensis]